MPPVFHIAYPYICTYNILYVMYISSGAIASRYRWGSVIPPRSSQDKTSQLLARNGRCRAFRRPHYAVHWTGWTSNLSSGGLRGRTVHVHTSVVTCHVEGWLYSRMYVALTGRTRSCIVGLGF